LLDLTVSLKRCGLKKSMTEIMLQLTIVLLAQR